MKRLRFRLVGSVSLAALSYAWPLKSRLVSDNVQAMFGPLVKPPAADPQQSV